MTYFFIGKVLLDFLYSKSIKGEVILNKRSFISSSLFIFSLPLADFVVDPFFSCYSYSFAMSIIKFKYSMKTLMFSSANKAFEINFMRTYASYLWKIFCLAYLIR